MGSGSLFTLGNFRKIIENPRLIPGACRTIGRRVNQHYYRHQSHAGAVDVMEEDWDTLIILDGCRYDLFAEQCSFDGELQSKRSPGSDSSEFIQKNFTGKQLHDTVYITANPFVHELPEETFHAVVNLLSEAWDTELETVPPKAAISRLLEAREQFPNKRLICHMMQPHFPFIGETGQRLAQGGIIRPDDEPANSVWARLHFGYEDLDLHTVRQAYKENLIIAFDAVKEAVESFDEKLVLTADHGNLIGERMNPIPIRGFGHPPNIYMEELVRVPWFISEGDVRPEIIAEQPTSREQMNPETVNNRLEALGYR